MKCCICKEEIEIEENGWASGNNAEPVMEGRCCNNCNMELVIPKRIKNINGGAK